MPVTLQLATKQDLPSPNKGDRLPGPTPKAVETDRSEPRAWSDFKTQAKAIIKSLADSSNKDYREVAQDLKTKLEKLVKGKDSVAFTDDLQKKEFAAKLQELHKGLRSASEKLSTASLKQNPLGIEVVQPRDEKFSKSFIVPHQPGTSTKVAFKVEETGTRWSGDLSLSGNISSRDLQGVAKTSLTPNPNDSAGTLVSVNKNFTGTLTISVGSEKFTVRKTSQGITSLATQRTPKLDVPAGIVLGSLVRNAIVNKEPSRTPPPRTPPIDEEPRLPKAPPLQLASLDPSKTAPMVDHPKARKTIEDAKRAGYELLQTAKDDSSYTLQVRSQGKLLVPPLVLNRDPQQRSATTLTANQSQGVIDYLSRCPSKTDPQVKIHSYVKDTEALSLSKADGQLFELMHSEQKNTRNGGLGLAAVAAADGSTSYRFFQRSTVVNGERIKPRWIGPNIDVADSSDFAARNQTLLEAAQEFKSRPPVDVLAGQNDELAAPLTSADTSSECYDTLVEAKRSGYQIQQTSPAKFQLSLHDRVIGAPLHVEGTTHEQYEALAQVLSQTDTLEAIRLADKDGLTLTASEDGTCRVQHKGRSIGSPLEATADPVAQLKAWATALRSQRQQMPIEIASEAGRPLPPLDAVRFGEQVYNRFSDARDNGIEVKQQSEDRFEISLRGQRLASDLEISGTAQEQYQALSELIENRELLEKLAQFAEQGYEIRQRSTGLYAFHGEKHLGSPLTLPDAPAERLQRIAEVLEIHKTHPPITIESNVQGVAVHAVDALTDPATYQLVEQAAEANLMVKLDKLTGESNERTATFSLYRQHTDWQGREHEVAVGNAVTLSLGDADYYQNRNLALARELSLQLEHPPIVFDSALAGVKITPVDYSKSPEAWQQLHDAGLEDVSVRLTGRSSVHNQTIWEYSLFDRQSPEKKLSGPIKLITGSANYQNERNIVLASAIRTLKGAQSSNDQNSASIASTTEGGASFDVHQSIQPNIVLAVRALEQQGLELRLDKIENGDYNFRIWSEEYSRYSAQDLKVSAAEVKDGEQFDISFGSRLKTEAQRLSRPYELMLVDYEGTAEDFRQELRNGLEQIHAGDERILGRLVQEGYTLHAQKEMFQRPIKFAADPRGIKSGDWETRVIGVHRPLKKEVVVLQGCKNKKTGEWKDTNSDAGGIALHEVGHAIGFVDGNALAENLAQGVQLSTVGQQRIDDLTGRLKAHGVSSSPEFTASYDQERLELPKEDLITLQAEDGSWVEQQSKPHERMSYYLQPGKDGQFDAGKSELWAEMTEVLFRGKADANYRDFITRGYFDETAWTTITLYHKRYPGVRFHSNIESFFEDRLSKLRE